MDFVWKRIGSYWQDNGSLSYAVNNLADSHNIVGITPGVAATTAVPYASSPLDQLNLLPGRSISLTITGGRR
jgi:hypothetical protein